MDNEGIRSVILDYENDDIEFKLDLSRKNDDPQERYREIQTIAAFYNTRGGLLIFGIRDHDREPVSIENPQVLENNLITKLKAKLPSLDDYPQITFPVYEGEQLVAVRCPKGKHPPYVIFGEDKPRIRVGSSNVFANDEQVAQMYRDREIEVQDRKILKNASIVDLDHTSYSRYFKETMSNTPDEEDISSLLKNEGFVEIDTSGQIKPTYAGILLFGKDPQQFLPTAVIRASVKARQGQESWDDLKTFGGTLFEQITAAESFLKKHIPLITRIQGFRRVEEYAIPMAALREAIVNAVVHRNYNDTSGEIHLKIEGPVVTVTSPGNIMVPLTIKVIMDGHFTPRTRNATIAFSLVRVGGFMEKRGSGIQRILKLTQKHGLPTPEFEDKADTFYVSISSGDKQTEKEPINVIDENELAKLELTNEHFQILELVQDKRQVQPGEVMRHIGRSRPYTNNRLSELVEKQVLDTVSSGKYDPNLKYRLHDRFTKNRKNNESGVQQQINI